MSFAGHTGRTHEHCCGFPQGQWAAIEEFAATCDALPVNATQPGEPAEAGAECANGTSASDGTADTPRQHEAVTSLPAASRLDAVADGSSAAGAAPVSSHEAQAAAVVEHRSEVVHLPAAADGSGTGSGAVSTASWPASPVVGDKSASSCAAGISGAARAAGAATPCAAPSETDAARDPHSAPQQNPHAVTAGPDHGSAEAEALPLQLLRLAVQPSDATAHPNVAGTCRLLPSEADMAGSGCLPAARERQQAADEFSARQQAATQASDAAAAGQRSHAAAASEMVSGAGQRAAGGGDAEDMGSSWESDVHAGTGRSPISELLYRVRATRRYHARIASRSPTRACQTLIVRGGLISHAATV